MDNGRGGFATAKDGKPYTTLLYADGPGFSVDTQGHRADITNVDTSKTGDLRRCDILKCPKQPQKVHLSFSKTRDDIEIK